MQMRFRIANIPLDQEESYKMGSSAMWRASHRIGRFPCFRLFRTELNHESRRLLLSLCLVAIALLHAEAKPLHHVQLQGCSANVRLTELKKYLTAILQHISDGDSSTALVTNGVLHSVKVGDRCCFLRELSDFYLKAVFSRCNSVLPHPARTHSSPLANTFYIMSRDLQECGCECGVDTLQKIKSIRGTFDKMEMEAGVGKALCDLEILLSWMEYHL